MDNAQGQSSNQMTTDQNEKVLMGIKNLIEINHTGHQGYTTAAENVKNSEWAALFNSLSSQRHGFEGELKTLVSRFGGNPEDTSVGGWVADAAGALHRGWINIKSAVTGGDENAILEECQRGDEAAVKAYQEFLEMPVPQDVAQTIRQQYHAVQEAYTRVKGLARMTS